VASVGVVLAGVYMIRVFQRTMHNREGPAVESREIGLIDLTAVAPLVAAIVALGVYPNFVVDRTEAATVAKIEPARAFAAEQQARGPGPPRAGLATVQPDRRGR
jgi:NADH:ubiquinone oxidoreductase subunit 4 (subunit M)